MTKFVLSIDGGGIRGIIPAIILVELERALARYGTTKPLHECFDLIAGTSTGGIIAAALAAPCTPGGQQPAVEPEELVTLYEKRGCEIFNRRFFFRFREMFETFNAAVQEKYSAEPLEGILKEILGSSKMSDALTHLVLTAYDIEARRAVIMTNRKSFRENHADDYFLWEAVRATTAAPTFFEPARVYNLTHDRSETLIDGGVFASDPSLVAFVEALGDNTPASDITMLSLGTGYQNRRYRYEETKDWGPISWISPSKATPIISILMQGTSSVTSFCMDRLLNEHIGDSTRQYFRIDGDLSGCLDDMDDASPQNIRDLKRLAGEFVDRHMYEINIVARRISEASAS